MASLFLPHDIINKTILTDTTIWIGWGTYKLSLYQKKNSDILDISDPRLVSNNEKIMMSVWILFMKNLDIKSIIARIILQDWSRVQV